MSHTYWDPKGMVKKRPGGYTYHGGNTHLSAQYKDRYVPCFDPSTTYSNTEKTSSLRDFKKSLDWNKYQDRTWYQDHLDNTAPEFEDFPGRHAEWRKEGEFEKSYRTYNSKFVYDFRVNVTTTHADGTQEESAMRTADHTEVQRMRKLADDSERYDRKQTVDFNLVDSPLKPISREATEGNIKFFDSTTKAATNRHPAINPNLRGEHPRETFRSKEKFPLFWSETQKQEFKESKSSCNLLDYSTGRTANSLTRVHDSGDPYPYIMRPMTSHQITLRTQGSRDPPPSSLSKSFRRPQSGYERGLCGTLQKNDGWRDEELLSNAGKISFHPLSFDVLETLSFPRAAQDGQGDTKKQPMSAAREAVVHQVFEALAQSRGTASVQAVMKAFCPSNHPAVLSGRVSQVDLCDSFILDLYQLSQFELEGAVFDAFEHCLASDVVADVRAGERDFDVTRAVFFKLYDCYSQGVRNDGYFQQLVQLTWPSIPLAGSSNSKRNSVTSSSYIRRVNSSLNLLK